MPRRYHQAPQKAPPADVSRHALLTRCTRARSHDMPCRLRLLRAAHRCGAAGKRQSTGNATRTPKLHNKPLGVAPALVSGAATATISGHYFNRKALYAVQCTRPPSDDTITLQRGRTSDSCGMTITPSWSPITMSPASRHACDGMFYAACCTLHVACCMLHVAFAC